MQINETNLGLDYSNLVKETYFFLKLKSCLGMGNMEKIWILFDTEFEGYDILKK